MKAKWIVSILEKYKGYNKQTFIYIYFSIILLSFYIVYQIPNIIDILNINKIILYSFIIGIANFFLAWYFWIKNTYGSYLLGSKKIFEEYKENDNDLGYYDLKNKPEEVHMLLSEWFWEIYNYLFLILLFLSGLYFLGWWTNQSSVFNNYIISVWIVIVIFQMIWCFTTMIEVWFNETLIKPKQKDDNENDNVEN